MNCVDTPNDTLLRPVLHQGDTAGTVLIAQDVVYRLISTGYQEEAKKFLRSELFEELVSKRLFPRTVVNKTAFDRGELVLEHERAPFILQGWEWSFSMLKDAALTILAVADLCEKYGYYMQDAHIYNVVFFSGHPMFVDFGSFREGKSKSIFPRSEYLRYFYIPLMLWSEGNFYFGNRLLLDNVQGRRFQPFERVEETPLLRNYLEPFKRKKRSEYWMSTILNMFLWQIPRLRRSLIDLSHYQIVNFDTQEMRVRLESLCAPPKKTEWETYHDSNFETGNVSPRFRRIMEIIGDYKWETAVDVAGNSGYFTELLARQFNRARFLSLDYDSRAIDTQYCRIRESTEFRERVTVGMVNIKHPEGLTLRLEDRIRADLVLALAITHHLLLRQKSDIDTILQSFYEISRKYLVVEFMPLGLWNGTSAPPIPAWYTKEWFRAHLEGFFNVLLEEQLEPNRIIYLCEKSQDRPNKIDVFSEVNAIIPESVRSGSIMKVP